MKKICILLIMIILSVVSIHSQSAMENYLENNKPEVSKTYVKFITYDERIGIDSKKFEQEVKSFIENTSIVIQHIEYTMGMEYGDYVVRSVLILYTYR